MKFGVRLEHRGISNSGVMKWGLVLLLQLLTCLSEQSSMQLVENEKAANFKYQLEGIPHKDGTHWSNVFLANNLSISTCNCWMSSKQQVECKCHGPQVSCIPDNFDSTVQSITIFDSGIRILRKEELRFYRTTLMDFVIEKASHLTSIEAGVFTGFDKLQRIFIRRAELLTTLPVNLFQVYLPKLRVLAITETGLRDFPMLTELNTGDTILHQIDLKDNKIEFIPSNSVRLRADDFLLDHNAIRFIEGEAFNGSQIASLRLRSNYQLTDIDMNAFIGLESLRQLDLSETAITVMPVHGLSDLEILRLANTRSLKEIPSVYNYESLLEAYLTYPYHCCAFKFPATHDPNLHAQHTRMIAEMQKKYCNKTSDQTNERKLNQSADSGAADDFYYFGTDLSLQSSPFGDEREWDDLDGVFHQTAVDTDQNNMLHAYCGKLTMTHRQVKCTPQPDAFNPCEDIMGTNWLRVAAWMVASASVVGNLAVIIVLSSSRSTMVVSKFLMINLATADLFMGIYLFLIAGMDLHSSGVYFNYANDWQNGIGCKIAGFLTVFSTELSVFTLVVITSERWITITYAVNLNRRLRMSSTMKIIAVGWVGAIIIAALPLMGVSNFSTTSICLPLGVQNIGDLVYILLLLVGNALGFISICFFYGHMYYSISDRQNSLASHSDAAVAKKMALLVFTNLACLAPITFFGLTAATGYPLIDVTHSKILLVFVYPLNACTNPYLYAVLTKQYRRDLYSVLSRHGLCKDRASCLVPPIQTRQNRPISIRANPQFQSVLYHQHTYEKTKCCTVTFGKKWSKTSRADCESAQQRVPHNIDNESKVSSAAENVMNLTSNSVLITSRRPTSLSVSMDGKAQRLSTVEEIVMPASRDDIGDESIAFLARNNAGTISPFAVRRSAVGSPHPVKHCQVHQRQRDMAVIDVNRTPSPSVQAVRIVNEDID